MIKLLNKSKAYFEKADDISYQGSVCRYYLRDGVHCVIGAMMPDAHLLPNLAISVLISFADDKILVGSDKNSETLKMMTNYSEKFQALQEFHDTLANQKLHNCGGEKVSKETMEEFRTAMLRKLEELIKQANNSGESANSKTKVIFRIWRGANYGSDTIGDGLIALFPEIVASPNPSFCLSYESVGGHGAADARHIMDVTDPIDGVMYADLKRELEEGYGYEFEVVKHLKPEYYQNRLESLRRENNVA